MKELIDTIESIGFRELGINSFDNKVFHFKSWIIMIHDGHWELTYQNSQPGWPVSVVGPVSVAHTLIPLDDRKILLKYFRSELREEKLKELGI